MDEVLGAFRNREHALIEAAPGIGKRSVISFRLFYLPKRNKLP